MKARLPALALSSAAVALAWVLPTVLAAIVLGLSALGVLVGPRLEFDRLGQVGLTFLAALIGVLLPRILVGDEVSYDVTMLGERRMLLALPVFLVAAVRVLMTAPRFGTPLTLVAGLVALVGAGGALPGIAYPLLCAAFLGLGLASLSASDPHRASPRHGLGRSAIVTGVSVALAGALTLASTRLMPKLHDAMVARVLERYRRSRTGFGNTLALGGLGSLLQDDTVVLRVRGAGVPELLRGAVYTQYVGGHWLSSDELPPPEVVETASTRPAGDDWVELENAVRPLRYFLPLDAKDVSTSSGFFQRDAFGIYLAVPQVRAKRVWFRTGGHPSLAAPSIEDRVLPTHLVPQLVELASTWGAHAGSPRERLGRLQAHLLRDYHYTLRLEPPGRADPVLDFLLSRRAGHCEYFASSLALLGRASGVATRVVAGYRVAEHSRFGYHVVRRRHAHSWVEAYVDGAWRTYDPTPASELLAGSPTNTPAFSAFIDAFATGWEATDDWLEQRSAFEYALVLVLLAGGFVLVRVARSRRAKTRRRDVRDAPLPGFVHLDTSLTRKGLARSPHETLERFASRVLATDALAPPRGREIAELIRAYADLRYAGRGDCRAIERRLVRAARSLG